MSRMGLAGDGKDLGVKVGHDGQPLAGRKMGVQALQAKLSDAGVVVILERLAELPGNGRIVGVTQVWRHDAVQPGTHGLDCRFGFLVLPRRFFRQLSNGGFTGVAVFARVLDCGGNGRN